MEHNSIIGFGMEYHTVLSESEEKVAIFKEVLINNMVDVVGGNQQLAKLNGRLSIVGFTSRNKPVNQLRSCVYQCVNCRD